MSQTKTAKPATKPAQKSEAVRIGQPALGIAQAQAKLNKCTLRETIEAIVLQWLPPAPSVDDAPYTSERRAAAKAARTVQKARASK